MSMGVQVKMSSAKIPQNPRTAVWWETYVAGLAEIASLDYETAETVALDVIKERLERERAEKAAAYRAAMEAEHLAEQARRAEQAELEARTRKEHVEIANRLLDDALAAANQARAVEGAKISAVVNNGLERVELARLEAEIHAQDLTARAQKLMAA